MEARTGTLVIGIGNSLRGDDGVGRFVAREVADWNASDVQGLEVHQLLPEHAALLATVKRVIFVDACAKDGEPEYAVGPVRLVPEAGAARLSHQLTPGQLLALGQDLFGDSPEGWLLAIPVVDTGFAEDLSEMTRCNATCALGFIAALIAGRFPGEGLPFIAGRGMATTTPCAPE